MKGTELSTKYELDLSPSYSDNIIQLTYAVWKERPVWFWQTTLHKPNGNYSEDFHSRNDALGHFDNAKNTDQLFND